MSGSMAPNSPVAVSRSRLRRVELIVEVEFAAVPELG